MAARDRSSAADLDERPFISSNLALGNPRAIGILADVG
jgi:hypothetical protein